MTLTSITPSVFAGLEKELAQSHQATMAAAPTSSTGVESGTVAFGDDKGIYEYTPSCATLTMSITKGGNIIKDHIIWSKVKAAVAELRKVEVGGAPATAQVE